MRKSLSRLMMAVVIVGFVGSPALAQADPVDTTVPAPPPVVPVQEVPAVPAPVQVPAAPALEVPAPVQVPVAPPVAVVPPAPVEPPPVVQAPPPVVQQPVVPAPVQVPVAPVPPVVSAPAPQQPASPPQETKSLPQAPVDVPKAPEVTSPKPSASPVPSLPNSQDVPPASKPAAPNGSVSEDPPVGAPAEKPAQLPTSPNQGTQQQPQTPTDQPSADPKPSGAVSVPGGQPAEGTLPEGEDGSKKSEQGSVTTNPSKDAPTTDVPDVKVVEAPKPAEALPVPEEVLAMKPEVVTVAAIDDDKRSGPRLPKPGRDNVNLPNDDDKTPPANPNIVINGDNNTVNIINIVDSKVGDINQDVSDNDRYIVVRNLDWPGHDLRFPVRPNHPIQLPPNWCGGQSGAWAFAGVGIGPSGAYANFGAGVFHSNGNCGYDPRPPRPQHWPAQLVICPPAGYYGHPQRFDRYTFINETTVFVNNTFVQGRMDNQVIQGAPQQVFVPNGFSRDIVYQPPTQAPPAWLEFETGRPPVASAPTGFLVEAKRYTWGLLGLGGVLLVAVVAAARKRA